MVHWLRPLGVLLEDMGSISSTFTVAIFIRGQLRIDETLSQKTKTHKQTEQKTKKNWERGTELAAES